MNISELELETFLEHHGVKGMQWGIRKSKKVTGISRTRGIILDRNRIMRNNIELARQGDKFRVSTKVVRAFIGEQQQKENWKKSIISLNAQDARLKSKREKALTFMDRVDMTVSWNAIDALITVKPGKKKK